MPPVLSALDHLVLTVADADRTVAFYCDVLGMRAEVFHPADGSRRMALVFGAQKINLHVAGRKFEPKAAHPAPGTDAGAGDVDARVHRGLHRLAICSAAGQKGQQEGSGQCLDDAHQILAFHLAICARTCSGAVPP